MEPWAIKETFHRVATQPGSTVKKWDREELIRCRAIGTGIAIEPNLKGEIHPVFANWIASEPNLHEELEQPVLLASKILEAAGLPWLSDFLVDDIFDKRYLGRECGSSIPIPAYGKRTTPHSIVRRLRVSRAIREKRLRERGTAWDTLQNDFPKLIQWQLDKDMFQERGWNGYTCRHPRGDLPLSEIDKYETIKKFDSISPHEGSRNLTILVMAEYPARLAELRRQGKAKNEEYLLTAFMATVTLLHELGHAIYWKDRRSLTCDMREPFYGSDLEMELGDSFVAAIFGGWIPRPVCKLSRLREDFSFTGGIAWRQALNWDHHRMRPKYRAHYSIPVDYIACLFTNTSWLATSNKAKALVRPKFLTGNSMALRTVGIYAPLTRSNRHATAAIADFHCDGDGWTWNRRPGAWFRIPQYDGSMYPELELPTAGEDAVFPPVVREPRRSAKETASISPSSVEKRGQKQKATEARPTADEMVETIHTEVRVRGRDTLLLPLPPPSTAIAAGGVIKLSPRKSEYSPRKFALGSPTTKITRPIPGGPPVLGCDVGVNLPRKWDTAQASQLARDRAADGQSQRERQPPPLSPLPGRRRRRHPGTKQPENSRPVQRERYEGKDAEDDEELPCPGCGENNNTSGGSSEISLDELKKRLSQLIGVSLTELEKLFDGPHCRSADGE
ncbi:hypothetical protein F5X98DRAFT_293311 [Xylaria grammica]|nr:hypothetical protein F5X98DRAFT_293311 [Xylaria grammica]